MRKAANWENRDLPTPQTVLPKVASLFPNYRVKLAKSALERIGLTGAGTTAVTISRGTGAVGITR
jgi:hypothetical protein